LRFWDASAVVPLLIQEAMSTRVEEFLTEDPEILVWWGTSTECASALSRARRSQRIPPAVEENGRRVLAALRDTWQEVWPSDELRRHAERLVRVHPLRAGDAFQLAAALITSISDVECGLVSFDERLKEAARLEGLYIV
jgi:predicted nucleic acid-binding protein